MLGICFFVAQFAKISFKYQPAVFLVVLWISSVRENLVNIQITGFLALLFTFGCSLVKMKRSSLQVFLGCILVAVSMDSKPHLFGLATVVFFFLIGRFRLFFLVMTQVVLIHAILSAYIGKLLTKSWLNTLFGIYEIRKEGKLGESLNLWPIIESFGVSSRVTSQLSMILFGFIAILFFYGLRFRRINEIQSILLAFIVPSFGIFYHYYDLSLVMSLFFVSAIISQHLSTAIISLPIFLVPSGFLELKNFSIVLGILVMLRISGNLYRKVNIKDFLTMIFIYIGYSTILLTLPIDIRHQSQVTFTVVFVTLTILLLNFQDSKSIIPRKVD